jgi:hypothetical protein
VTPAGRLALQRGGSQPDATLGPERVTEVDDGDGGAVLACARCRQVVTTAAARIDMAGSHAHTFVNPHGIRYVIGCFADAAGCAAVGFPSSYFTWFPGHTWQVACCAACGEHLGWLFRSADSLFYGLILDRLVEIDRPGR